MTAPTGGASGRRGLTLRWRLALLVLLPMLPMLALVLEQASQERDRLIGDAQWRTLQLARAWSDHHEGLVREAQAVLAAAERVDIASPRCGDTLRAMTIRALWPSVVAIADREGRPLCVSDPSIRTLAGLGASYLEEILDSRGPLVSEFRPGADGHSVAYVGWRLADGDVVLAQLPLDEIQRRVATNAGVAAYTALVFSRTGVVLTSDPPAPELVGKTLALDHPLHAVLNTQVEGTVTGSDGSRDRIFAFTQMPETGAKIAISLDRAEVVGPEERATRRILLILVRVALLAMLGAWLIAEIWVARSVAALVRSADAFRQGNLEHRAVISGGVPEFHALAAALNRMAREIGARHRDLEAARADLERRGAALVASEQRFRDIAGTAGDFFWERDPAGRYTFVSDRFEEVTGVSPDIVLDKLPEERASLVAGGEGAALIRRAFAEHVPFRHLELQVTLPSREIRWWRMSGKPVFDQGTGSFLGFRGAGNEITAAKHVEAELLRAKEAAEAASRLVEAANQELERRVEERTRELEAAQAELLRNARLATLGQLTATVAHELRNPLGSIKNTLFTLREVTAAKGLDLSRPIDRMERGVERCNGIISDLLDYSRTRELRRQVRLVDPWLAELLLEQPPASGIVVRTELGAAAARVSFDPERLRRLVLNLVENAVQAMSDGGASSRKELTVRTTDLGAEIELVVADTGPGIAPENLARIFEPLFSTKSFGTGLGLPTVKQIVEQHGGRIAVDSAPGVGTRVAIRLPAAEPQQEAA